MDSNPQSLTEREVDALADAFHAPVAARQLLAAVGLPASRQPNWQGTPLEFWREVNALLAVGVMHDGRNQVLAAARRLYPANPAFAASDEPVQGMFDRNLNPVPSDSRDRSYRVQIGGDVIGQFVVGENNVVVNLPSGDEKS